MEGLYVLMFLAGIFIAIMLVLAPLTLYSMSKSLRRIADTIEKEEK